MAMASRKRGRFGPSVLLALLAGALWLAPPLPERELRRAAGDLSGAEPSADFPAWGAGSQWKESLRDALASGRALSGGGSHLGSGNLKAPLPPPEEMPEFTTSWEGYRLREDGKLEAAPDSPEAGVWTVLVPGRESGRKETEKKWKGSTSSREPGGRNEPRESQNDGRGRERKVLNGIKSSVEDAVKRKQIREKNLGAWTLRKAKKSLGNGTKKIASAIVRNRPRPRGAGRFRPILLSKLLGLGAIRPPPDDLVPPDFQPPEKIPANGPAGERISGERPRASELERVLPPAVTGRCAKKPHWHSEPGAALRHEGTIWGHWARQRWSWLLKHERRWWLEVPAEAREGEEVPPLVHHGEHWWWKAGGRWFLLHQGEPWAYRSFEALRSEGLIHPRTGTQMIYSADAKRVAVVTPGEGAVLFDAENGTEIARWTQGQMPKPRRPAAPKALNFEAAK